ncbi:MAG: carboxypeptidase-like regulatory domain-containing protein, partial [Prevotella sp.]
MKKSRSINSGFSLLKVTALLSLSALLCVPLQVRAEGNAEKAMSAQSVQQGRTVKGNVVDETGEPMIGVTVKVKGGKSATVTDLDGNFTISAAANDMLEISYIGYKTQTVKAGTSVSIKMKPEDSTLNEVVVIGYGTQKKRDLTGAISSVKSEDIKQAPVMNAMEGLQGKISGLDITRSSGQAG